MHLYSVTILERTPKIDLADYFYTNMLGLPGRQPLGKEGAVRWYTEPPFLAIAPIPYGEDPALAGGFTGVQLNLTPLPAIDPFIDTMRQAGGRQPEPRDVGGLRLLTLHDPCENTVLLVAHPDPPDEPLMLESIGAVSVFVSDLAKARAFYVGALGLAVRAEPHPGLLVLGERGTALMLYQVPTGNPATPIGRRTGIALADADPAALLEGISAAGGEVMHRLDEWVNGGGLAAATLADPDGNVLTLFATSHITRREAAAATEAALAAQDAADEAEGGDEGSEEA